MVTEQQIMRAKNSITALRDKVISAKSLKEGLENNIKEYEAELTELGVDPKNVDAEIEAMTAEIDKTYKTITERITDVNEVINNINA